MKIWWIEQRYVVPVVAETLDDAIAIAFRDRKLIAQECGGIEKQYRPRFFDTCTSGWENCVPYGNAHRATLGELEAEGIK
jgi:hypothetical protein